MLIHTPVLLTEVLAAVPETARFVMDGTLGHGWHTLKMLEQMNDKQEVKIVGVDRDDHMMQKAKERLQWYENNVVFFQGSYAELERIKSETKIEQFDFILLDIGVNMDHFKVAERGFSLKLDGPLDMRFDTSTGIPVATRLKSAWYDELQKIFTEYCDFGEKYVDRITHELLNRRKKFPLATTGDMKKRAAASAISDKKLAVIFQAFRIFINKELAELERFLALFPVYLAPGGRCCIISYHSGEDRKVKNAFKLHEEAGLGKSTTKHVIKPERKEIQKNKAARSAKMRIRERAKNSE